MSAVPDRKGRIEEEMERERLRLPLCFCRSGTICAVQEDLPTAGFHCGMLLTAGRIRKEGTIMAKERFVEVYSQGVANVEKIIVDTQTGVNYLLASSAQTAGCGMSVLVDAEGKPIVTPVR